MAIILNILSVCGSNKLDLSKSEPSLMFLAFDSGLLEPTKPSFRRDAISGFLGSEAARKDLLNLWQEYTWSEMRKPAAENANCWSQRIEQRSSELSCAGRQTSGKLGSAGFWILWRKLSEGGRNRPLFMCSHDWRCGSWQAIKDRQLRKQTDTKTQRANKTSRSRTQHKKHLANTHCWRRHKNKKRGAAKPTRKNTSALTTSLDQSGFLGLGSLGSSRCGIDGYDIPRLRTWPKSWERRRVVLRELGLCLEQSQAGENQRGEVIWKKRKNCKRVTFILSYFLVLWDFPSHVLGLVSLVQHGQEYEKKIPDVDKAIEALWGGSAVKEISL